MKSSKAKVQT